MKRALPFCILIIIAISFTLGMNSIYLKRDKEIVKYLESIRSSYWASWRFGRELYNLDREVRTLTESNDEALETLLMKVDFVLVTYEFLTTDYNVFENLKEYSSEHLGEGVNELEKTVDQLKNQKDWIEMLPELKGTIKELKRSYDKTVFYELKGDDLTLFISKVKEEQKELLYIIYASFLVLSVLAPLLSITYMNLRTTKQISETDELTGLPNRKKCLDLTEEKVSERKKLCCFFLDLNGFKAVNDSMGHKAGDELLQVIAKRVSSNIKKKDIFARIGGDEFILIIEDYRTEDDIEGIAKRIMTIIGQPIEIEQKEVSVGVSIGISCLNDAINSVDKLFSSADDAMYIAKGRKAESLSAYEFFR